MLLKSMLVETSSSLSSNNNNDNEDYQRHKLTVAQENSYENDEILLKRKENRLQCSSSKCAKTIQSERGHEIKDKHNKAIPVENNILPINDYKEKLKMNSKRLSNKNVTNDNNNENMFKSK